jgi:hypothetical protein
MKLNFILKEKSRSGQFFISLMYEGGDADTDHPVEHGIKASDGTKITYLNYQEYLTDIEKEVNDYKKLQSFLDANYSDNNGYKKINDLYGDKLANMYDNTPNDPQTDFQFKCTLDSIKIGYYDESGDRYESYT